MTLGQSFLKSKYILVKELSETFFFWYFPFKTTVLGLDHFWSRVDHFFLTMQCKHNLHHWIFSKYMKPEPLKRN